MIFVWVTIEKKNRSYLSQEQRYLALTDRNGIKAMQYAKAILNASLKVNTTAFYS